MRHVEKVRVKMWVFCRTDYQIATLNFAKTAQAASIFKAIRFSDHAPLTIDYAYEI